MGKIYQNAYIYPTPALLFLDSLAHKWSKQGMLVVYFKDLFLGDPSFGLDALLGDYITDLLRAPTTELTTFVNAHQSPEGCFDFELEGHPWEEDNVVYRYDPALKGVTRIFKEKNEEESTTTQDTDPKKVEETMPDRAKTVREFGLLLLRYGSEAKGAPDFESLKKIVRSFKKELGQYLKIAEEGKGDIAGKEGIWNFLYDVERQRFIYGNRTYDKRKTHDVLNGIVNRLQGLMGKEEIQNDQKFRHEIQLLVQYIVHYQTRERDKFVEAQNIIHLIKDGKIDQINRVNLVHTLGEIRYAMNEYLKGKLNVPLLAMLDKRTSESMEQVQSKAQPPQAGQDHRKTNAFLDKLKRGLATIEQVYAQSQPFIAYLANDILKSIKTYQTRVLESPNQQTTNDAQPDPVTLQYQNEIIYTVIAALIDRQKAGEDIFAKSQEEQEDLVKKVIKELQQNKQATISKYNIGYRQIQTILYRFEEWNMRRMAKEQLPKLFKSREEAFKAAKAEARKLMSESDNVVWDASTALEKLYLDGVIELIKKGEISLKALFQKNDWKALFEKAGLNAIVREIRIQEGYIYGAKGSNYAHAYDYVSGHRMKEPKSTGAGNESDAPAPQKNYKEQLKEMVIDHYVRYVYAQKRLKQTERKAKITAEEELEYDPDIPYDDNSKAEELGVAVQRREYSKKMVLSAKNLFRSVAKSYFLNYDFGASSRNGFWISMAEGIAENSFWKDYETNADFAQGMAQAMQFEGLPLTKEQQDKATQNIYEKVGAGIGASIPIMLEIMVTTLVTEGLGTLPAIARAGDALYNFLTKVPRFAKAGHKIAQIGRSVLVNSIAFKMAGQNEYAGMGEGLVQGIIGGRLPLLKLLQNPGSNLKIVLRGAMHHLGKRYGVHIFTETAQEYGGDMMANLVKHKSIQQALKETFGYSVGEAGDKLLVTALVCAAFGKVGAIKGLVIDTKNALQVKREQAKSQNAKNAYNKAIAILQVVDMFSEDSQQLTPATPYQIKKAPEVSEDINESPELTILYKKLEEQQAHQTTLEEALGDLKGEVPIYVQYDNPQITGKTVRIYRTFKTIRFLHMQVKVISQIYIKAGPDATAQHIAEHVNAVKRMQKYQGYSGRVSAWARKFSAIVGWHGKPGPETRLGEAQEEIQKISEIIHKRSADIQAGRFNPKNAQEIAAELYVLGRKLEFFEDLVKKVSSKEKGLGYVAVDNNQQNNSVYSNPDEFQKIEAKIIEIYDGFYDIEAVIAGETIKPAWKHVDDGCSIRAHLLSQHLEGLGIKTKKVFAFHNDLNVPKLEVETKYAQQSRADNVDQIHSTQLWNWHVAVYIDGGPSQGLVIDPALSTKPVTIKEWLGFMGVESYQPMNRDMAYKLTDGEGNYFQTEPVYIIADKAYIDSGDLLLPEMFLNPRKKMQNEGNLSKFKEWMELEKYNIIAEQFRTALEQQNYEEDFYLNILRKFKSEERVKFQSRYYRLLKYMEYVVDEFEEIEEFINGGE